MQTDSEIEEFIRGSVHSGNALIGTCRMGRDDDSHAVLDSELRVRGVGALRVIDASAMPAITGGQTCAPTIMIAEKGADLVLRQRAILEGGVAAVRPFCRRRRTSTLMEKRCRRSPPRRLREPDFVCVSGMSKSGRGLNGGDGSRTCGQG